METKQKHERYLIELRPYIAGDDYSSPYFTRRLNRLMSSVGGLYLWYVGKYKVPYTTIIHLLPVNALQGERFAKLGHVKFTFGRLNCFLQEERISQLSDEGKRQYIANEIHASMLFFAQTFNLPTDSLHKAYDEVLRSDFYDQYKKMTYSPNRKYQYCLLLKDNWGSTEYWIKIEKKGSNESNLYHVINVTHYYSMEHSERDNIEGSLSNAYQYIWPVGWFSNTIIELESDKTHLFFDIEKAALIDNPR